MTVPNCRMNIAYISTWLMPSAETQTEQGIRTIEALVKGGHSVDLLCPRRRVDANRSAFEFEMAAYYGIEFAFPIFGVRSMPPLPLEAERLWSAMRTSLCRPRRYDLVLTRSRGVLLWCALRGEPVVFETYRNFDKSYPIFRRLLLLSLYSGRCLGVVCHSEYSARSLQKLGILHNKVSVVYNGWNPALFESSLSREAARTLIGIEPKTNLVAYTGNVQPNKGLNSVLDVAVRLPDVTFLIVGGRQDDLALLSNQIKQRELRNIVLVGHKKAASLGPFLLAADILIIPPTDAPLEKFGRTVLPMKTFMYLGAGRPIVAPRTPDIMEILADDVNAVLVEPDNPVATSDAIASLLRDTERAWRLGKAAAVLSRQFTWEARADRLVKQFRKWLAMRGAAQTGG